VASSCERGNEASGYISDGSILHKLSHNNLLTKKVVRQFVCSGESVPELTNIIIVLLLYGTFLIKLASKQIKLR
jgi:hypothetical protein